jgi:hypothetical protein
MILAITDGVGLTNKLSAEWNTAEQLFRDFFEAQIRSLEPFACGKHWRIIKTTGDGLLFACVEDEKCKEGCSQVPCHQFLAAIAAAAGSEDLKRLGVELRSVIHYYRANETGRPPVLRGWQVGFDKIESKLIDKEVRAGLLVDVFGLEVIRLSRIASIAKGPFHLVTQDFVHELAREYVGIRNPNEPAVFTDALKSWRQNNEELSAMLRPDPIPLPHLKGFDDLRMGHAVTFGKQYHVWELDFTGRVQP